MELDFVDLPNYIKIKLLIGDCGFYINEIEGMYLDVIGRNILKKLYPVNYGNLKLTWVKLKPLSSQSENSAHHYD